MECRGFFRRLKLRVEDVPLLRLYNSTARFLGLPMVMALAISLHALDYSPQEIAFAGCVDERTVRATIEDGKERIGAGGAGDCVRILRESDPDLRRAVQRW